MCVCCKCACMHVCVYLSFCHYVVYMCMHAWVYVSFCHSLSSLVSPPSLYMCVCVCACMCACAHMYAHLCVCLSLCQCHSPGRYLPLSLCAHVCMGACVCECVLMSLLVSLPPLSAYSSSPLLSLHVCVCAHLYLCMIVYMVSRMVHLKRLKKNFVAHTDNDALLCLLLCARILFFSSYSIDSDDEILCSLFFSPSQSQRLVITCQAIGLDKTCKTVVLFVQMMCWCRYRGQRTWGWKLPVGESMRALWRTTRNSSRSR